MGLQMTKPVPKDDLPDEALGAVPDGDLPDEVKQRNVGASGQWRSWSDVPGEAVRNLPSSAGQFAGGLANMVKHPVDTAMTLFDAAAGGLRNIMPNAVSGFVDRLDSDNTAQNRITNTANAVGQVYKDRYGSMEGFKNTLATDPVGAAADLSTVLGGGALLTKGTALSNPLSIASKYTNPLTPVVAGVKGAANVTGTVAKNLLGLTSGVGGENVSTAYQAGKAGNKAFLDNLNENVPITNVLDDAKANLSAMRKRNSAAYRSGMVDVKSDKTVLDFAPIDKAISEASDIGVYKGQIKNPEAVAAVKKMSEIVDEWKNIGAKPGAPAQEVSSPILSESGKPFVSMKPAVKPKPADADNFHTPEGMDALKQKLGGILESIPFEQKTARLAAGKIYGAVKETIAEQAPTYDKVMKNYHEASDLVREIEKTLSLKPTASVDTALRKLQSLTRNNVNTNYGHRGALAKSLESAGGKDLMPALAGQAMNSWTPRGLQSLLGAGNLLGMASGGFGNPYALAHMAMLPMQSPKLVGLGAYGAGALSNLVPGVSDASMLGALLMQRGGALEQ